MTHRFYLQNSGDACGEAVSRTILFNNHGIEATESELIRIAAGARPNGILSEKEKNLVTNLLKDGTDLHNLKNIADHFGLVLLGKNSSTVRDLKFFIDLGLWPIIHRPSEIEPEEGHYIVSCGYNGRMQIFDPALPKSKVKEENYEEFNRKWYYPELKERWFGIYVDPEKLPINKLRKYL